MDAESEIASQAGQEPFEFKPQVGNGEEQMSSTFLFLGLDRPRVRHAIVV